MQVMIIPLTFKPKISFTLINRNVCTILNMEIVVSVDHTTI